MYKSFFPDPSRKSRQEYVARLECEKTRSFARSSFPIKENNHFIAHERTSWMKKKDDSGGNVEIN